MHYNLIVYNSMHGTITLVMRESCETLREQSLIIHTSHQYRINIIFMRAQGADLVTTVTSQGSDLPSTNRIHELRIVLHIHEHLCELQHDIEQF